MCPPPMAEAAAQPGIILVVEDDPLILDFLCEILEEEGFKVRAEESADIALPFLEQHFNDVSLLLTDITMPGVMNGADLANRVGDTWPHMPIMIMSGFETPETSGVRHDVSFIKKPWGISALLDCVQGAIKKQHTHR
ncbi:response regulator [Pseudomonas sp. SZMC_28357]|uniref:response regulator n=1 Tax=Pseudomonas sp. SZMC_28357 TaxID=3074380 RepID=UPI00287259DC|nr:response regulator [Pseudomonas sp. SZMC_28357]MDR9754666.1 response regulator [Pseudomonas sp. SZMC_28357]